MHAVTDTLKQWLADHPPPAGAFKQTLAGVSRRVGAGAPFMPAVRELLDEFALLPSAELCANAIAERPAPAGDPRHDAFLGALGEHLAAIHGLERPEWTCESARFLGRFWFVSDVEGFRAVAIASSPAAFRRRGIFISSDALERC
jgi:hypothetical protein